MELLKKLKINTEMPLWLINAPEECLPLFAEADVKEKPGKPGPVAQLMLFVADRTTLSHYLPSLAPYISHQTLLWICYPKKSGAIRSDLIGMTSWDFVFDMGYRAQTSVSINDNWTGLRITSAPVKKPSTFQLAPEDRNIEGIDFVNRTVELPLDAANALAQYPGMTDFFNAMAFTHKKEYIQAIAAAKKPETRTRRIEKTVEMLQEKMHAKTTTKKK